MIRLYDFVEILKDEYVCVIDLNGLGMQCKKDEIRYRFNNDVVTEISTDFSQNASDDILNFVYINGYCINDN